MESRKMVLMNLSGGQQWRRRLKNRLIGMRGRKESVGQMEIVPYTPLYVKRIASGNLLYDSRSSNWCSVTA